MKLQVVLGVVASCLLLGSHAAGDDLKDTLLAREKETLEAIKQKDGDKLKKLLASQSFSITSSERRTTQELLKTLEKTNLTSYSITEAEAVAVGKDVGILTYKFTWSGSENGKEVKNAMLYATSVWELRDGKWMIVFYQETPIDK